MFNKNIQELNVDIPLYETKKMWDYQGKSGKSWYNLRLVITYSKTLYELEYFNHKTDQMLTDYFENKNDALQICKSLEQLNGD